MIYLGNIDTDRLNGIGLGNMWANIVAISVGWGLAGGLDTLCSQANGARDFRKIGIWLQRAILIMTFLMIPISFAFIYTEKMLLLLSIN
jgi:MATE family multidrug resistance protein